MGDVWQENLSTHWGIDAPLRRLDGEYDLNFRTESQPGHVLKAMRPGCDSALVEMQWQAMAHVQANDPGLPIPKAIVAKNGAPVVTAIDSRGAERLLWVQEALSGREYASIRPQDLNLVSDLGHVLGRMNRALKEFDHPSLHRDFKWDLMRGEWIADHLDVVSDPTRRGLLKNIIEGFNALKPALDGLPKQAIHNDANDYNILVEAGLKSTDRVSGLVDFGDMCAAPRVCELAIAGAYVVLDRDDPEAALAALVATYHAEYPLSVKELDLIWPLLRMRLAVSVVNSSIEAKANPDDPYVTISQAPAWRFLENEAINGALIPRRLRAACGLPITNAARRVGTWLDRSRGSFAPVLDRELSGLKTRSLSAEEAALPQDPFSMTTQEAATCVDVGEWSLGYYREPRLIYTDKAFRLGRWKNSSRRNVHLGIDVFAPAGTPVCAPHDATVWHVEDRNGKLDYGGLIVLRHETPDGDPFFSLYGHLAPVTLSDLTPGDPIAAGEGFALLGAAAVNGGWAPHLHFQLALSTDGMGTDWPGVADPDDLELWEAMCPNPAALLNLPDADLRYQPVETRDLSRGRAERFSSNLKLSYSDPVALVRGWRHHLFDQWGRPYLDAYNNVPHVGHAHPRIQAVAAEQLQRLNTNTRYLHPAQMAFADEITSHMPDPLSVCFFVNSGTEANELALRLARAATGGRDMITPDHGYHGNTTGAIDISAYKFNAPGGVGQPDWVQLVEVADEYRGSFRRDDPDRATKYAALVDGALERITARGGKLAGFIAETYPSVGGQIIPPTGYLAGVYERIRAAGGICIADEVQTGLGRLGSHYFAFEEQRVVPDIVVLGKPIGNGHPLGVVVTTREIADAFAQGPEYFSTFGGSTLSCRIGYEVLRIVEDEGLMENASVQGDTLMQRLQELQARHDFIGDVRGIGLFIGVDLVTDREGRASATQLASFIKERLRQRRVLVGTEGPADNVLKVRPPLTIDAEGAACFLHHFSETLDEAATRL